MSEPGRTETDAVETIIQFPKEPTDVTRKTYSEQIDNIVRIIPGHNDFIERCRENFSNCIIGANSAGSINDTKESRILRGAFIIIDETALLGQPKEIKDLVVLHEKEELWYRVCPGGIQSLNLADADFIKHLISLYKEQGLAHFLALRDEYLEAKKLGLETTLLNFLSDKASSFYHDIGRQDLEKTALEREKIAFGAANGEYESIGAYLSAIQKTGPR